MSDGHSDSARYSKFYRADQEAKERNESIKLAKMSLVLTDESVVDLKGVQLMFSESVVKDVQKASVDTITEDGSRMINLTELIRAMIRKGLV